MGHCLVAARQPHHVEGVISRFDPRFWTVNFPRPMMAAVTTSAPDVLRVAKMHEQVIGCYAMHSPESSHSDGKPGLFELGMVMVLDTYQRNGVGRWLIGHAIGVAESKGGRELLVTLPGPADFFQGLGFRQVPSGFLYEMRPE